MFVIRNRQEFNEPSDQVCDAAWGFVYQTDKQTERNEGWTCLGEVFQFKTAELATEYAQKKGIELGFFEGESYTNLVSIVPVEAVQQNPIPEVSTAT